MIPPWYYIIIPAATGFCGALLAIFLTPRFQHYFWKRQKREEIRLAVVTEVNRLAAEFQSNYLFKDHVENTSERTLTFAQLFISVSGQVKDLFSHSTYQAFDNMRIRVLTSPLFSTQAIGDRVSRVAEFELVCNTAMHALYTEIGILKGETRWSRFKRWIKSCMGKA